MTCPHTVLAHVVVFTLGTAGDLYPLLTLARAFQRRGHRVTLVGPTVHADLVAQAGLPFHAVGTREGYTAVISDAKLWHPIKGLGVLFRSCKQPWQHMLSFTDGLARDEPCILVAHPLALPVASLARAARPDLHIVGVYLAPTNMRSCADPMVLGDRRIPRWMPMPVRRWLWRLVDRTVVDPMGLPSVNELRQARGEPPVAHLLDHFASVPDQSLTLFPDWFAPTAADWPQPLHRGPFPLYDPVAQVGLPDEVTRFLATGASPVVFTPGTGNRHATRFFAGALAAVQRLGLRAIFLTPQREQVPAELPDTVLWQAYAAFPHLLPRVKAIVHHGGIGTTAQALQAGVPQLVVAMAFDQFDNGWRVQALGAGLTLASRSLRTRTLVRVLRKLLDNPDIQTCCRTVAANFGDPQASLDALCGACLAHSAAQRP